MPVRGIPRALDGAFGCKAGRRIGEVGQAGQGVIEEMCYCGFH
jgi:hypothetical protein